MIKTKNKIALYVLTVSFTAALFLLTAVNVFAAGPSVYLDGQLLIYTATDPEIINDRTMVPLAETATYLGMQNQWDPDTGTMYFTKGSRTMEHTIYSNVIYVNGIATEFDVTSTIINGKTLMPVRMLAEALGCEVEWDGSLGRVLITSEAPTASNNNNFQNSDLNNLNTVNNNNNNNNNVNPIPSIYGVSLNKSTVGRDETVRVTVDTNNVATRVKVETSNGETLRESSNYSDNGDGKRFEVEFTPPKTGEIELRIYAGTSNSYDDAYQSRTINVKDSSKGEIIKITYDEKVSRSSSTTVEVRTSTDIDKVEIQDEKGNRKGSRRTSPSSESSNYYTWKMTYETPSSNGSYTYVVVAYDDDGNKVEYDYDFTVSGSSGSSNDGDFKISEINYDKNMRYSEWQIITVYMSEEVDYVWLSTSKNGSRSSAIDSDSSGDYRNGKYIYELELDPSYERLDTGSHTFYIIAEYDGKTVNDSISIRIEN